jgi:transposase
LAVLKSPTYHFKRIGLEAGPLSQWLFSALAEAGLPAICVETRQAAWRKNIRYKFATYYDGWKAERQVEQFGVKPLRVLMLTTSAKRVENMLAVLEEITEGRGSNFFLFGHREQLEDSDPLTKEWVSGTGQLVKLTD